jgi:hypothetical protein
MKNSSSRRLCRLGLLPLSLLAAAGANAETSPYYIGAGLSIGHSSNLFPGSREVTTGELSPERSDTYNTVSLFAGFDQPISRQRVYANLELRRQTFNDFTDQNNTGYSVNGGLDWETVGRLSGKVVASAYRGLASYTFNTSAANPTTARNIEDRREFEATIQKGQWDSRVELFGGLNLRDTDYSADAWQPLVNRRASLRGGVRYHPSSILTLGTALTFSRGKYPNGVRIATGGFEEDQYDGRGIDFLFAWVPTGASTFNGRIGYERRSYDQASRDFSGITGLLSWRWQPTGKLTFETSLLRDSNDGDRLVGTVGDTVSGGKVSNSLIFNTVYAATAKISANLNARYTRQDIVNPLDGGASDSGRVTVKALGLGVSYEATRWATLGCTVARESRKTSSLLVSFPYSVTTSNCYVRAIFR